MSISGQSQSIKIVYSVDESSCSGSSDSTIPALALAANRDSRTDTISFMDCLSGGWEEKTPSQHKPARRELAERAGELRHVGPRERRHFAARACVRQMAGASAVGADALHASALQPLQVAHPPSALLARLRRDVRRSVALGVCPASARNADAEGLAEKRGAAWAAGAVVGHGQFPAAAGSEGRSDFASLRSIAWRSIASTLTV